MEIDEVGNITLSEKEKLTLSALFHDLGKSSWRRLPEEVLRTKKGILNHEALNKDFIEKLPEGLRSFKEIINDKTSILRKIYKVGDWIAAQQRESLDDVNEEYLRESVKKRPLKNIFNREYYYRDSSLSTKFENFFVKKDIEFEGFRKELDKKFKKEISLVRLKGIDFDELIVILASIIQKYTITIPEGAYKTEPLVDLFTHTKLTTALTIALYEYYKETGEKEKIEELYEKLNEIFNKILEIQKEKKEIQKKISETLMEEKNTIFGKFKPFLSIRGDLSGIQNFIFNIKGSKALKNLKWRSFFISFLMDVISQNLAKKLGMTYLNILFCSGGNFEIIAHNTKKSKDIIEKFGEEINKFLFDKFRGILFLDLSYEELSAYDFSSAKSNEITFQGNRLNKKNRKFIEILDFVLKGDDVKTRCEICDAPISNKNNEGLCNLCLKLGKLNPKEIYEFLDYKNLLKKFFGKNPLEKDLFIRKININNFNAYPFKFYGGIPPYTRESGKRDYLNIDDEGVVGDYLGAAKLDVDNLGKLFRRGGESLINIFMNETIRSRLSFNLYWFFEGIILDIHKGKNNENEKNYHEKVSIIFSGGDDLFIIGQWDYVLEFLNRLYKEWKKFVGFNEKITLSASFNIFRKKYPIKKIAEELEEELENAKEFPEKNRISIMSNVFRWGLFEESVNNKREDEFKMIIKLKKQLGNILKKEKKKGFLNRIIEITLQIIKSKQRKDLPKIWAIRYYVYRSFKKLDKETREFLRSYDGFLRDWYLNTDKNINPYVFIISAKLVELESRK